MSTYFSSKFKRVTNLELLVSKPRAEVVGLSLGKVIKARFGKA